MSHTATKEHALLDQLHRHDTTHRARVIGRSLREPAAGRPPVAFEPDMVADLPEPARRWLTRAIEPGTPLVDAVEIEMHGEIKLGRWRPFTATQALVPDAGFVWAARTRVSGMPVRGFDSYCGGAGVMRWRVLGVVPVQSATGYDITRSAADRLVAESVLLPTSLVTARWRSGDDDASATYHRNARSSATIRTASDGGLLSVGMQRWGKPSGRRYAQHRFEVRFGGEYPVGGLLLPDAMSAAWVDANGARQEFFRAAIDVADLYLAAGGRRGRAA
jgi:hypothetical protein